MTCRSRVPTADALFDAQTKIGIHVAPVLKGAVEHRLADPVEEVSNNVGNQPIPLCVIHHLTDECGGLTPVVVFGV